MKRRKLKSYNDIVRHLLPISGSKICALSSAQTARHKVTSWWPVAFTGVMAGSTVKWSKQCNKWGTHKDTSQEHPYLNLTIPSSKAFSSIFRLRSWLPESIRSWSWPDSGTKRRLITACFCPLDRLTSASVDTSPASDQHGPSLAAPGKEKFIFMVAHLPKYSILMLQTWRNFHGSTGTSANNLPTGWRAPSNKSGSGITRTTIFCLLKTTTKLPWGRKH